MKENIRIRGSNPTFGTAAKSHIVCPLVSSKLLAGIVLHGPSIGNLFRRILRANAHIRTRYQNVIDMRKPIDRVLHALRSTSAEAEETSISPSSLRS